MTTMRNGITKALTLIGASISAALLLTQSASAVPISAGFVGTSGATGQNGVFAQDINFDFGNTNKIPGANLKYTLNYSLIGGSYQISRNVNSFVLLPYVHNYFRGSAVPVGPGIFAPVSITRKGLSDPSLGLAYIFYRQNGLGYVSSMNVGLAMGLPLGSYDDPTVPRALQPGTGNFVPAISTSYYFQSAQYGMVVVNFSYFNPLERNGYKFPSTFNYNFAVAYPIYPSGKLMSATSYSFVPYLHLELLGTKTGKQHATNPFVNGVDANTGGNLIKLAPAVSIEGTGWEVAFQYMIPISQSLNGTQPIKFDRAFLVTAGCEFAGMGG